MVNYQTTGAITGGIGATVDPAFVIRRAGVNLLAGRLPVLNLNVPSVINIRAILGSAGVPVPGDLELVAGDLVTLVYVSDGLSVPLNLGNGVFPGITWAVHRI